MHFLTSLIILVGFAFVVFVGLVKVIWEFSQLSFHESPVIREAPGELAAAEYDSCVRPPAISPTGRGPIDPYCRLS